MATRYASQQTTGFKNHITKIAVVGAGGTVGKYIVDSLLKGGKHTVTAITRAESNTSISADVRVAKVNYGDKFSLVNALKGQEALIISLSVSTPPGTQAALIDAAAEARVPWVMPNEWSPDYREQPELGKDCVLGPRIIAAQQQIENLGVSSWLGLVCSHWYEHSLAIPEEYGFDFRNRTVTFMDDGNTKVTTSTWQQCGRAVAALFSLPILPRDENDRSPHLTQWKNKEVYCSSFCLSQRDMLNSVIRVTGLKESDWTFKYEPSVERFQRGQTMLKGGDLIGFRVLMYARVFFKDGCGDLTLKLDNDKLGLPKEDLYEATKEAIKLSENAYGYMGKK